MKYSPTQLEDLFRWVWSGLYVGIYIISRIDYYVIYRINMEIYGYTFIKNKTKVSYPNSLHEKSNFILSFSVFIVVNCKIHSSDTFISCKVIIILKASSRFQTIWIAFFSVQLRFLWISEIVELRTGPVLAMCAWLFSICKYL